jgi:hypothetical protein
MLALSKDLVNRFADALKAGAAAMGQKAVEDSRKRARVLRQDRRYSKES